MIEQFTQLMIRSGAAWVLWVVAAMSLVSVAVILERAWVFRRERSRARMWIPELRRLARAGEWEKAQAMVAATPGFEATVLQAALSEAPLGAAAVEEVAAAAVGMERSRLERGLLILGTIGNNAPFVGLLGTVIGVVGAFDELSRPEALAGAVDAAVAMAPEGVMAAVAEALVATAAGLMVAIPAVAAFNYFHGRISAVIAGSDSLTRVVVAELKAERDDAPVGATSVVDDRSLRDVVRMGERTSDTAAEVRSVPRRVRGV